MEYGWFGRTGWRVSEIAVGGWQLSGVWGPSRPCRARQRARTSGAARAAALAQLAEEPLQMRPLGAMPGLAPADGKQVTP